MDKDEVIRKGVRIIKTNFLRWRKPVDLPADSVIENCVMEICKLCEENKGLLSNGKTPDF